MSPLETQVVRISGRWLPIISTEDTVESKQCKGPTPMC